MPINPDGCAARYLSLKIKKAMYLGSCLCGEVKYRIDGEIESSSNCHCTMCQKQHGAAFASYGNVRLTSFSYLSGSDLIASFESSTGVTRKFCKRCGSNLSWHSDHIHSDFISVALGTLDTPYRDEVTKNIYTDTSVSWLQGR